MLDRFVQGFGVQFNSLGEFLDSGGWVTHWILVACIVLMSVVIERIWFLWRVYPGAKKLAVSRWNARQERQSWAAQRIRMTLISQLQAELEAGLSIIRVMAPMAPLLGLLGTVMGMLQVFDAMAFTGSGDTRAMADGISHAMIATMTGLVVSVLALIFGSILGARVRRESERLSDLIAAA